MFIFSISLPEKQMHTRADFETLSQLITDTYTGIVYCQCDFGLQR